MRCPLTKVINSDSKRSLAIGGLLFSARSLHTNRGGVGKRGAV